MDKKKIGKFIAECRKAKGLTQFQLAEKLDISDRAVSKWETGSSIPDNELALALCKVLDINVSDLFAGERTLGECCYDKSKPCRCGEKGQIWLVIAKAANAKIVSAKTVPVIVARNKEKALRGLF